MKKKNGAGAGRSVWSPQAKNPSGWKRTTQKREVNRTMFAYVRLCSLNGEKIVAAPSLISDASALGSPLKKRAVAALGERGPVYFCGTTAWSMKFRSGSATPLRARICGCGCG